MTAALPLRFNDFIMKQPSKVTVLLRRAVAIAVKAPVLFQAMRLVFIGEWRIDNSKIKLP